MLAGLRFGAGPEGLEDDVAVARRWQFAGAGVDAHQPYARRHAELDRRLALQRGAHEFLEDRHRDGGALFVLAEAFRSEEHTSELQSLMRISYAVFCLKTQNTI